jgi:serine/threonine protein phosphatase PrpC
VPKEDARLTASSATDVGRVRTVNEDSLLIAPPVFLVADGMGGHKFGDLASREVVDAFRQLGTGEPTTVEAVVETIRRANDSVRELAGDATAGTTLAGVALVTVPGAEDPSWMVFNVGDSRVYSWSGDILRQVSVDHSAVQELIDAGEISEAEARSHPQRNVVTAALGAHAELEPDVWVLPTGGPQAFLICSDGLTKEVTDAQITSVLRDSDPRTAAQALVDAALANGGADNVSVVIVDAEIGSVAVGYPNAELPAHLEATRPSGRSAS